MEVTAVMLSSLDIARAHRPIPIETIAERHGVHLAPLFNAEGSVEDTYAWQTEGATR
jgi:hypothetical protein